jgi:ABC-type cobalamin/Fe3+-siderophores transport system ATPase subunit
MMNGGRIVANGTPSEVLTTERIEQVFGVEPTMIQTENSGIHLIFN